MPQRPGILGGLARDVTMQFKPKQPFEHLISWVLLALAVPLLWWGAHTGHQVVIQPRTLTWLRSVLELLAIMVALQIFVAGYRALASPRKGAMVMLGLLFLGVGVLDFLHVMHIVHMAEMPTPGNAHLADLLWLAARALAAAALLGYVVAPDTPAVSRLQKRQGLGVMLVVVCLCWGMDRLWDNHVSKLFDADIDWPSVFAGLSWSVLGVHLISLAMLWLRRRRLRRAYVSAMSFTVGLLSISDLFLMKLGMTDKQEVHVIGHGYMVAAYLYLFQTTLKESLRQQLASMAKQHQRQELTLRIAPNGILWVNKNGTILDANPAVGMLTGYRDKDLVGQNIQRLLPERLRGTQEAQIQSCFTKPDPCTVTLLDEKLLCRDGSMLPVDVSVGFCDDEDERHAIVYINNLTERKKFEATLHEQAIRDALTKLPNRSWFYQRLQQTLSRESHPGAGVFVLLLDLDDFKTINDSFGHATGDALLVQVVQPMRSVLRASDTLARLGGDEFAILLDGLAGKAEATQVASKLLLELCATYQVQGLNVNLSASVGVASFPDDGQDADTLLRYAEMAMYAAKAAGRGTCCLYSPDMERGVHEDMQIHMRLKEAIGLRTLTLLYQPQVDVVSGAIVGVEALLRWVDPVLGQVSPARFIPVAESSGLILPLSDWVLETACSQIAAWMRVGTPVRVAVNFSAQQFHQPDLCERIADTLRRTGATAQWLDIEITESMAMVHTEKAEAQLHALVALGCRVALDDFGTGYSSLAYLKSLPIHKLKIDKSFIDGVPHDTNNAAISRAIIALAHSLGMQLIAEGVETDDQLAFLRQHGCEAYQGWLFAKAMPAQALATLLAAPAVQGRTGEYLPSSVSQSAP